MKHTGKDKIVLWSIFLLALLVRLVVLLPQYSGDVKNHVAWGMGFLVQSLGLFGRHFPGFNDINYPSAAILIFGFVEWLYRSLNSFFIFINNSVSFFPSFLVPFLNWENTHIAFYKLPGLISDLGTGWIIYLFSRRLKRRSLVPTLLYLFNPAVIYTSSVWGQIEPINIFFLVLSLYFGTEKKPRYLYYSLISFTFSALIKQTALWFLPFYLILWFKNSKIKEIFVGLVYSLIIFFVSYLPFGLQPLSAIQNYLSTLTGSTFLAADQAWNIWYFIFPKGTQDSLSLGIFSLRTFSIIILGISLAYLLFNSLKHYSGQKLLVNLFIWSLLVFFLQTRVHERHLAFAISFFWLAFPVDLRSILGFVSLSAFHLFNLYSSLRLPFL